MNSPQRSSTPHLRFGEAVADDSPRLSMAPLVDIVLLLVCFYLLVSRAVQTHEDPEILLPEMAEQRTQDQAPAELVINLREDGALRINQQPVPLEELPLLLQAEQARHDSGEIAVTIRADGRQRYGQLQQILRICREVGIAAVVLRASEEPS